MTPSFQTASAHRASSPAMTDTTALAIGAAGLFALTLLMTTAVFVLANPLGLPSTGLF